MGKSENKGERSASPESFHTLAIQLPFMLQTDKYPLF